MFVILNNGEMGTSSRARRSIIMFVMFVMFVMFIMFVMFVYQLSIGLLIASHVTPPCLDI